MAPAATATDSSPGCPDEIRSASTRPVRYIDMRFHAAGGLGEVFTAEVMTYGAG